MKTYNFIEACNSGKQFRVVGSDLFRSDVWYKIKHGRVVFSDNYEIVKYQDLNFINSTFALEEKKVEITESEFDEIIGNLYVSLDSRTLIEELKKELGF